MLYPGFDPSCWHVGWRSGHEVREGGFTLISDTYLGFLHQYTFILMTEHTDSAQVQQNTFLRQNKKQQQQKLSQVFLLIVS